MNQYDALVIAKNAIDAAIDHGTDIDGIIEAQGVIAHMIEVKERGGSTPKSEENKALAAKFKEYAANEGLTEFTTAEVRDYLNVNGSKATAIIKAGGFAKKLDENGKVVKTEKRITYLA